MGGSSSKSFYTLSTHLISNDASTVLMNADDVKAQGLRDGQLVRCACVTRAPTSSYPAAAAAQAAQQRAHRSQNERLIGPDFTLCRVRVAKNKRRRRPRQRSYLAMNDDDDDDDSYTPTTDSLGRTSLALTKGEVAINMLIWQNMVNHSKGSRAMIEKARARITPIQDGEVKKAAVVHFRSISTHPDNNSNGGGGGNPRHNPQNYNQNQMHAHGNHCENKHNDDNNNHHDSQRKSMSYDTAHDIQTALFGDAFHHPPLPPHPFQPQQPRPQENQHPPVYERAVCVGDVVVLPSGRSVYVLSISPNRNECGIITAATELIVDAPTRSVDPAIIAAVGRSNMFVQPAVRQMQFLSMGGQGFTHQSQHHYAGYGQLVFPRLPTSSSSLSSPASSSSSASLSSSSSSSASASTPSAYTMHMYTNSNSNTNEPITGMISYLGTPGIGLRLDQFQKLPVIRLANTHSLFTSPERKGEECGICVMEFEVGEFVRDLTCRHIFHKNCIDRWLVDHTTCPMCRQRVG